MLYNFYISPRENIYTSTSYIYFFQRDITEELHQFLRKHKEIVTNAPTVGYGVPRYQVAKKPSMDAIVDKKVDFF
jgi:hypothetical protein